MKKPYTIIALGGSLIVKDAPNKAFLKRFRHFILGFLRHGRRFVIVAGGGKITRRYQEAARSIVRVPDEDVDWLGIHATRLNAHLLRTIFWKEAHPVIIDDLKKPIQGKPRLIIAAGTRPGWSTDYVATMLARRFHARRIIIAGTYDGIYDKDFEKYRNAKRLPALTWKAYRKLIASSWQPGYRAPIDPVAAAFAERFGIEADVVKAENFKNFSRAVKERGFDGSVIR